VKRYVRLVRLFWSTSLAAEMEYRANFVMASLSSAGTLVGSLFALSLFYRPGTSLGGWSFLEALLVTGMFTALQGFSRMLLTPNLNRIVEHVRTGTLDFVLVKPIDSQFWLSLRRVSPWGAPDALFGLGILGYAALKLGLSPWSALVALVPILASMLILYSLWYVIASTTIWYVKIYNVTEVLQALLAAGRYPIQAFPPGAYRFVFTFVIPVAFLTTVPAQALLGRASFGYLAFGSVFAALLFLFSRAFWRFALRSYTSASS
jgi:ABC-2 type transport system permease protein